MWARSHSREIKAWEWEPRKPLKGMTRAGWRSNAPLRKPMIGSQPPGRPCLILADNNRARALALWQAVLYFRPAHQYLPVPPLGGSYRFCLSARTASRQSK